MTIIDGTTFHTTTLAVGANPAALAVDWVIDKVYVANDSILSVSVIDGATNQLCDGQRRERSQCDFCLRDGE